LLRLCRHHLNFGHSALLYRRLADVAESAHRFTVFGAVNRHPACNIASSTHSTTQYVPLFSERSVLMRPPATGLQPPGEDGSHRLISIELVTAAGQRTIAQELLLGSRLRSYTSKPAIHCLVAPFAPHRALDCPAAVRYLVSRLLSLPFSTPAAAAPTHRIERA